VQLAQINVARLVAPSWDPRVAEFFVATEPVNILADRAPGFVWRRSAELPDGGGHLTTGPDGDPLVVVNLSVWTDYEHLHAYVYRTLHAHFVRRRREWFEVLEAPTTALWWVPDGHRPTVDEGIARLTHLRRYGPEPRAFGLRTRFGPGGEKVLRGSRGGLSIGGRPARRTGAGDRDDGSDR
jgi:hypothetical protein